ITISINEAASINSLYVLPTATDKDSPRFGIIRYELFDNTDTFGLKTIKIKHHDDIDSVDDDDDENANDNSEIDENEIETITEVKLSPFASSQTSSMLSIEIIVLDSNDNRPTFIGSPFNRFEINVDENRKQGSQITRLEARDPDLGDNGRVGYSFSGQTTLQHGNIFSIDNKTGSITVIGELDYERVTSHQLVVIAHDHGSDPLTSEATVLININDLNDNAPTISIHTLTGYMEKSKSLTGYTDSKDQFSRIDASKYQKSDQQSKFFALSTQVSFGEFRVETVKRLDRETTAHHHLIIKCQDSGNPSRISFKRLIIYITDVNDCPPLFSQQVFSGSLEENAEPGTSILRLSATDSDIGDNGRFEYKFLGNVDSFFYIDQKTGVVSSKIPIDREKYTNFRSTIIAVDRGEPKLTGSASVEIHIKDVNDEKPIFDNREYRFSVSESGKEDDVIGYLRAKDNDSDAYNQLQSTKHHNDEHNPIKLDPITGLLSLRFSLDREQQEMFRFIVKVFDIAKPVFSDTAIVIVKIIDINDNKPEFTFP
ncbi:hypothetical protein HELRODRAFT_82104, partial [Helobdella robusta]|uniref:Cadherin domain-containing protein n=1 Tax=Helobdella robusta TaxID=6412 RepID=T1G4M8_HELRO